MKKKEKKEKDWLRMSDNRIPPKSLWFVSCKTYFLMLNKITGRDT